MRLRLFVAALAAVTLAACAHQYPFNDRWYPTVRPDAPSRTVLPLEWSVTEAYVVPMIDPRDAYAITFHLPLQQSMTQCPILSDWRIEVAVQPQLEGTRVYDACPRAGCYCAIFTPDEMTALNYKLVIARFQQGAPRSAPDDHIQFKFPYPIPLPVRGSR